MASVRISAIRAERCDFDRVVGGAFRRVTANGDQHHAELRSYGVCLRKNLHHLCRSGGGGNVIVGRFAIKQQIAYASAGKVRGESPATEGPQDLRGVLRFVRREVHRISSISKYQLASSFSISSHPSAKHNR